MITFKI